MREAKRKRQQKKPRMPVVVKEALKALIDEAEERRLLLVAHGEKGSMALIEAWVVEADVVVGVWNDPSSKGGIGWYVIKGEYHLQAIAAENTAQDLNMVALPCIEIEQAVALQRCLQKLGQDGRQ